MKRIGDILTSIFDEKMAEKAEGYSAFFSCWEDLIEKNNIPATVASHSWIKSVDKGLVWIEVDHPGCKQILQTKERKLLHDFRYRFPSMNISGISIMLCRSGARPKSIGGEALAESAEAKDAQPLIDAANSAEAPSAADDTGGFGGSDGLAQKPGYDGIKNQTLKKMLMRLEKNIADREKPASQP